MKKIFLFIVLLSMTLFTVSCETPIKQVESIIITVEGGTRTIRVDETLKLTATVIPDVAEQKVVWTSSNPDIAVVDSDGLVTPMNKGSVNIIATSIEDKKISQFINIEIGDIEDDRELILSVPENITIGNITYEVLKDNGLKYVIDDLIGFIIKKEDLEKYNNLNSELLYCVEDFYYKYGEKIPIYSILGVENLDVIIIGDNTNNYVYRRLK